MEGTESVSEIEEPIIKPVKIMSVKEEEASQEDI